MKSTLFLALTLTLALPTLSQTGKPAAVSRIGQYSLVFPGPLEMMVFQTGKLRVTATAPSPQVVKLWTAENEIRARKIVADAEQRGPKRVRLLTEATLTGSVYAHFIVVQKDGSKTVYTITCDSAVFKGGAKPKTGRLDFSGNVHFVTDPPTLGGEVVCKKGFLDLGDPDDPEKPVLIGLDSGEATGTPTLGKKK